MRRFWGLLLVAVGAFALVLGLLVKFYAEPRIVRAPLDQKSSTQSVSDGRSQVLDAGTGRMRQGLTLVANREVRGVVDGSKDPNIAVWHTGNAIVDRPSGDTIHVDDETVAFDRVSGQAVNCCGEQLNGDPNVRHSGLFFKFPFGTERKTYQYWDTTARKAFPAVFKGTENRDVVDGGTSKGQLEVYHFQQVIPATALGTQLVPPNYVGRPGTEPLQLTTTYTNTRDLWVEPISGEIVDGHEQPKQTLNDAGGAVLGTAFATNIGYTPATRDAATLKASEDAQSIYLVSSVLPAVLLGVGPLLLLVGLVLLYLDGRTRTATTAGSDRGDGPVDEEGTVVDLRDDARSPETVDLTGGEGLQGPTRTQPGPA